MNLMIKTTGDKVFNRCSILFLRRCLSDHISPYPKLTKEERQQLTTGHITDNIDVKLKGMPIKEIADVDPDMEPFNQIYQGVEDRGFFTRTENVLKKDPSRWFWVERLLVKNNISNYPSLMKRKQLQNQQVDSKDNRDNSFASGYQPINHSKPDLPYFIGRIRTGLYPVYKKVDENQETVTILRRIEGDVWTARDHLISYLSKVKKLGTEDKLVTVNEVNGSLTIRGDHVIDVINFLCETGF